MRCAMVVGLLLPAIVWAQAPASNASSTSAPTATAQTTSAKPAQASALANAVQARTPEEQAKQSGMQFIAALDHYLGAGTFVDTRSYSYLATSVTIIPQFLFGVGSQRLVASATFRGTYEYTLPDAETGRRWSNQDLRVGVAAPAFFKEKALTNIAFTPSIGLTIPTSLESWNAGLITSLSGGVTMSRSVQTVDFRANVSGSRGFFGQAFSGIRTSTASQMGAEISSRTGYPTLIGRPGESFSAFAGWNTAWTFSAGGQVQWRATGSFLLYVGYTYLRIWRNSATMERDEYSAKALDSNGNPVSKTGYGNSDMSSAYFGASYQLNEHYSLDLGAATSQTPLTPTGQVRFPFLSFGTWANNSTSLYFTLTAAY